MNSGRIRLVVRRLLYALGAIVALLLIGIVVLRFTNPRPHEQPKWQQLASMPRARGEVAASNVGPQLVVTGGLYGIGRTSDDVYVYDIARNEWTIGRSLPAPRHHAAAAALGRYVYVAGGASGVTDWTARSTVWRARPGGVWRAVTPMPEGRQGHAMVAYRGHLYVVGGIGPSDRTLIYDGARNHWRTGAAMPDGRDHLRAVVWRDEIWVIGGRTGRPTRRVDIYDPDRDQWRRGPDLPVPMSAMAVGVVGDALHVVGGEDPAPLRGHVIRHHVALTRGRTRWTDQPPPVLWVHGGAFCVYEDQFVVAGGATRAGILSTISWTPVAQMYKPEGFPKQVSAP